MGKNFIGCDELINIKNFINFKIPVKIPEIPFLEAELKKKSNSHVLVLCVSEYFDGKAITIRNLKDTISQINGYPVFYNQDWYLSEKFIDIPLNLQWLLVAKNIRPESRGMSPENINEKYRLFKAVELTYAFFVYYFVFDGQKLWNNDYVWCSDVDDKGDQIYVGRYTDVSGLNADGFEIHRHLKIKKNYGAI